MGKAHDYSKGKIYKIVCNITGECYIGSTVETLNNRLSGHKYDYKKWLEGNGDNVSSFEVMKQNDFQILLLELYPCNDITELIAREQYWIELIPCINKNKAFRTQEESKTYYTQHKREWRKNNPEKYKEETKRYNDANREKYNETIHCECGGKSAYGKLKRHQRSKKHQEYLKTKVST